MSADREEKEMPATWVTLFVDDSKASQEAKRLLRTKEIPFETSPSTGGTLPTASYKEALFRGLGGVQHLVDLYSESRD